MNVCPTNSGTIVQARAQVLIGSLVPAVSCCSTLPNSLALTNGPFFSDRPMVRLWSKRFLEDGLIQLTQLQLTQPSVLLRDSTLDVPTVNGS